MKVYKESNTILNEKFSPTAPLWLQNSFIEKSLAHPKYNKYVQIKKWRNKNGMLPPSEKWGGRGAQWKKDYENENNSAYSVVKGLGKNLFSSATFTPMQMPSKFDESTFSDTNKVYFVHLVNEEVGEDVVWVPGIGDDLLFPIPTRDGTFKYVKVGNLNNKNLKEYCRDIVYIDKTLPENQFDSQTYEERENNKKYYPGKRLPKITSDSYEIPLKDVGIKKWGYLMDKRRKSDGSFSSVYYPTNYYIDKSGYVVDPDRYTKKLKELKRPKAAQMLEDIYNKVIDFKTAIDSYYYSIDMSNINDSKEVETRIRAVGELVSYYNRIVNVYRNSIDRVRKLVEYVNNGLADEYALNELDEYIKEDLGSLKEMCSHMEEILKDNMPTILDWDDIQEEE